MKAVTVFCALALCLFLLVPVASTAAVAPDFLERRLASQVLGEEITLHVVLPRGYQDSGEKFPVLYLLDGSHHIFHVAAIADFLSSVGKIPEIIVVGIDSSNRMTDFTPDEIEHHEGTGGGDRFADFLIRELLPFVESSYRTQPFRMICGHSYGGTLVFNLLLTRPESFGGYVAASPNLLVLQSIQERAKSMLRRPGITKKALYISSGEDEPDLSGKISSTLEMIQGLGGPDLDWRFEQIPGTGHASTPHLTVYRALEHVFREFWLLGDEIDGEGLKQRFEILSERLGYDVNPPLSALVGLGNRALGNNRLDQARSIFELVVSSYPESEWGYVSLGSVFYSKEDLATAARHFRKALEINPDNSYSREMLTEIDEMIRARDAAP